MKKYIALYQHYKGLIENGQMKSGDKMPSIRKAQGIFSVSRTTVQSAYFALQADGYIIASEKSGHYVSDHRAPKAMTQKEPQRITIKYDLKSGGADRAAFDIKLWQRYIKNALRQQDRLLTYGAAQGEQDLREALSDYIRDKRNVAASPGRIVVGAGVQSLLYILCSLIGNVETVSFPDRAFIQGTSVFESYGFDVRIKDKDADLIYVCPSHMTSFGDVMPIKRRLELVEYSRIKNNLIIEDDYDNDFVYQSRPTPSLYALSKADNVIYMGSFSNVLIPGIRISFMVLTGELAGKYAGSIRKFAQTASKTEQIALAGYIRDGHINVQTRKVRRHYTSKAKQLFDEISREMPEAVCSISDNALQVRLKGPFYKEQELFEKYGLAVHIKKQTADSIEIVLSPSSVHEREIPQAVRILKEVFAEGRNE